MEAAAEIGTCGAGALICSFVGYFPVGSLEQIMYIILLQFRCTAFPAVE
jgi:hypothetical protein